MDVYIRRQSAYQKFGDFLSRKRFLIIFTNTYIHNLHRRYPLENISDNLKSFIFLTHEYFRRVWQKYLSHFKLSIM